MPTQITLPALGTLGNIVGAGADGVILGLATGQSPTKALLKSIAAASPLCYTDDGGLYVNETTPFREDTADDVEVLPATPAAEDAAYFGLADDTFARLDVNITTKAVDLVATIAWEYWDGTEWTAVAGLVDGTESWAVDATGIVSVTFTLPTDWVKCTIDGVNGYWVRSRVSAYTSITTAPQVGQGWIVGTTATWTDDLTDFTDAGAGDVALLPAFPLVGDGFYVGAAEKFCKVKVTTSQARTGTATITLKYWDGSAWSAVDVFEDDTAGWSTTAGALIIHFEPPSDWVSNTAANGPNGQAGYFVVMELTAMTDVTQQPLATIGTIVTLSTGIEGHPVSATGFISNVTASALTNSGTTADSVFLLVNATRGTFATLTWTKADAYESWDFTGTNRLYVQKGDKLALVQITEDGSTEFANAVFTATVE